MKLPSLVLLGWLAGAALPALANDVSPEELERWFNSDSMDPPRYTQVNDGHLQFLARAPKENLHHHHNALTIFPSSLQDGWIGIQQCHTNLDRVPAAQVLFNKDRVRDIRIVSYENMEKAWVEDASVQMTNITANARLCIQASSRALIRNVDGSFSLRNGPFMRRFLDGYYPIRVSLDLDFATTDLQLVNITPAPQTGFAVRQGDGSVHVDALFEGKLQTEFRFRIKKL